MRRFAIACAGLAGLLALPLGSLAAQGGDIANAKPGRAPSQPIDEAYTKKILEYTTEKFFLSPLVDYLPASKTVPTPKAVLGDIAGAPTKLPYSSEVYAYMRMLAKATPRVKVVSIGTTEEGREMIAVAVASERLIARLDENRAKLAKLADPRTINMNDAEAEKISAEATPIYYVTGTIHSGEAGAPTALMELAYRLAVDESPYIRNIRDHVVTLITPVVEVDGRDRMVDIFNWHMAHPGQTYPNLVYWGHYVAHDNNRDAMGMTLKLTQNVLNTYVDWKAQVLHDLHESVAFLYDNTIGDGPYNAWLDPLLSNEWQMMGWNNVQEMTRMGMPGVFAHGTFDTWSPGYLMFIAATHNGISRLYETFGNGGTAETVERTLSAAETERTWYKQNPPLPKVKWSLRNNNNYEQTGLLVSLSYFANNRRQFLWNYYEKSKRSILKAHTEGPAAYIFSADDRRPGAQAELLRILQKQRVEIFRASAPFSATLPVKRAAATGGGRGGRGGAAGGAAPAAEPSAVNAPAANAPAANAPAPAAPAAAETRQFPAGSYIVRMDQPYSRIADALLDYQYWSPNDPQKNPYDDTGWTFPEGFGVQAVRVTDAKVLEAAMTPVVGEVRSPGGVTGNGDVFAINANGDNGLTSLRYALKSADFQSAEEPFESGGVKFARGSFIVRGVSRDALDKAATEFGVKVVALAAAPTVKAHAVRAARVAVLHTWNTSTQTEGWWRIALDFNKVPFEYISTQEVAKNANLNAKYDVILFPPTSGAQAILDGSPMWRNAMPWKNSPETPNIGTWAQTEDTRPGLGLTGLANLRSFVANGGVLVTSLGTSDFAIQYGLATGVSSVTMPRGKVVGSLLRARVVDDASPIVYGLADAFAVYSDAGEAFTVSNSRGGFGGRGGGAGGGGSRATGRGQPDDADVVQGRPALEARFELPTRPTVQPWQYAPITDDQLRNPLNIIPPDQRPRVALRYSEQRDLLVSGLLDGGTEIAQRPAVVDVPMQKGHVVLFANNPMWRGETIGSYAMVFNVLLHFDHLNAGRKLDER